ncbi:MAG: helix-turn-helix transcriptional regulator [Marinobacter sp.]|uniref:helix-turn-helix transcriptional regulator n=1 Tax=Marinobacter sp. TaxID=50741 RepID=UPI00299E8953|nr:helix-turn-helix transcriptional regulator [Marinobacter sp.]MDX1636063.1 helix-turn-helix transcriptional regulator [Marinobacter sp.]
MVQPRHFSMGDFLGFGRDFGIDYRFPTLAGGRLPTSQAVALGQIEEQVLPSGFRLTRSSLDVLQPYESVSLGQSPLLMVVVLQGSVRLEVGSWRRTLHTGMALSLQLGPEQPLRAVQLSGQRLETVTLALDSRHLDGAGSQAALVAELLRRSPQPVHAWRVPAALLGLLRHGLETARPALQRELILEGLAMQLMGFGLPGEGARSTRDTGLGPGDLQRLEAVRRRLEFAPAEDYSLADLARRAAMSPSSLRAKFRQAYGVPVFEYLRNCRLELARRSLEEGLTVQQAAHRAGYRHATNFATAFRRAFGLSPSDLG